MKSAVQIESEIEMALRACEMASIGLWTLMRYAIEKSDRPGTLRQNGRPLSASQLARWAGCDANAVTPMLQALVDASLIEETADGYFSRHLARIDQVRKGGAARVRKYRALRNTGCNTGCNADVTPEKRTGPLPPSSPPSHSPLINPQPPGEVSPDPSSPLIAGKSRGRNQPKPEPVWTEAFTKFWEAWPKSARKRDSRDCAEFWNRTRLDHVAEQVLAGLEKWKRSAAWLRNGGEFIEAPLVWLHKFRWRDGDSILLGHQKTGASNGKQSEFIGARRDIPTL